MIPTRIVVPLLVLLMAFTAGNVQARSYTLGSTGFDLSGDLSVTFKELDKFSTVNTNSRGDDPFNTIRARMYAQKAWTDNIEMFVEFLWDDGAEPRIQGAYLSFYELLHESLTLKVGMLPSPFGNYGHRSTYFNQNPLLGVPALWLTKTKLATDGSTRNADLWPYGPPTQRSAYAGGYDACWDYGANLLVELGMFQGQFAVTQGALSNPYANTNDGYQFIANLGLQPLPGLRFGVSGATAPWIDGGSDLTVYQPYGSGASGVAGLDAYESVGDPEDFTQTALGGWAEASFGRFQFFSEVAQFTWETPLLYEDEVDALSGYLEGRWNVVPGWYLAGRYDAARFSEVAANNDGSGGLQPWSADFNRVEAALGWRVIREGYIRLVYQGTRYEVGAREDVDILAVNWLFAF